MSPHIQKDLVTCFAAVVVHLLSCVLPFVILWTIARQASLSSTISRNLLKFMSIEAMMPSNHVIFCHPLFLLLSIFPRIRVFTMSQLFASCGQNIAALASAPVLLMNIKGWFPLGLTGWISLQSKDPQFSQTPQFKSINSSALSFLYSPTLTSIHGHWKNHSLD